MKNLKKQIGKLEIAKENAAASKEMYETLQTLFNQLKVKYDKLVQKEEKSDAILVLPAIRRVLCASC